MRVLIEAQFDFLNEAQGLLDAAGLDGLLQLASFHPHYRFEGEAVESPGNYSNRSPYPLVHFLRENMLTRFLAQYEGASEIPARNIQTLSALGRAALGARWNKLFRE